ncbi:unnamed protein product [Soboliphyme baturini]|uniref:G_PROTEIN_RECEP_F1_2 domain-containing protein n=1 Tax=Soboliphyme baturini TaxID=241478 RepID=A0A183IXI8_9BILA|nr:unnamed protein product [Soboliphyme baturini]
MAVAAIINASLNSSLRSCAERALEVDSLHEHIASKVALGVVYVLIFTTALFGNGLVIFVVIRNHSMQTVTNFFICNLALSDIFVNITSLWLTPLYVYLARWVWGRVMCHMMPLTQGTSIFISSLTLTAIAVDRYIVILNPFRKRMTVSTCLTVIVSIWLLSLMLVAPYALHMSLVYDQDCGIFICLEVWEYVQLQAAYGFVVLALQFGIPFLIITFCYSRIWYHLSTRNTLVNLRSSAELRRKKRLLKV